MPTAIEWAEETIQLFTGCSEISSGCKNCYARRRAWLLAHNHMLPNDTRKAYKKAVYKQDGKVKWTGEITPIPGALSKLETLAGRGHNKRVFIQSMGDLAHPGCAEHSKIILDALNIALESTHTFLILTKRPENIRLWLQEIEDWGSEETPNIWFGATVEHPNYEDRIVELLKINAAKHFVSVEPCLGKIDLTPYFGGRVCNGCGKEAYGLDLVICGGETGPGARPMHPAWVRSLRDQCQAAGVPFFFKSWGSWAPWRSIIQELTQGQINRKKRHDWGPDNPDVFRVGKKAAGRLLDGREESGWPE